MELSYIIYTLIAVVLILIVLVVRLELKLKRLLRGRRAVDLEGTIVGALKDIEMLSEAGKYSKEEIKQIKEDLKNRIKAPETIRFNPFSDVGGKQSFATAFINEKGDGVVISSLFSREKVSVFGKPVKNFSSEYDLTGEEKSAMQRVKEK